MHYETNASIVVVSHTITILRGPDSSTANALVFPNPVTGQQFYVNYQSVADTRAQAVLVILTGEMVANGRVNGAGQLVFSTSRLAGASIWLIWKFGRAELYYPEAC